MLKYTILLLTYCGLWQPSDWIPGSWKTYLYTIYTYSVFLTVYSITLLELLYLVTSTDEIEEIASNSFVSFSMISASAKALNIFMNKSVIFDMIILLEKDSYQSKIDCKNIILKKYNEMINKNSLSYIIMVEVTMIVLVVTFSIINIPNRVFTTNILVPFGEITPFRFWFIYIFQNIAHAYATSIHGAFDTLLPSMIYQICCQFSILQNRFKILPDIIHNIKKFDETKKIILEKNKLSECVEHHLQIYEWAKKCNNIFGGIIFLQYSISSVVLCVSVYLLTKIEYGNPEFLPVVMYTMCMVIEIFILCYSGNQVTIESINVGHAIYDMDWTQFELSTKKNLMMIMNRTLHPVIFTGCHFVKLSIDSFTSLIKLSYSAYNLLQSG
uniref:Odorant receptor n=1 Tax=Aphidius gifuensis TaxID=684658 RepID=A0A3S9LW89_APHGI|nr:odorant receptor [Aphidius gifuensis]